MQSNSVFQTFCLKANECSFSSQPAIKSSKLTIETPGQGVQYAQN